MQFAYYRGANWAAFGTGIPGDDLINAWAVHDGVIVAGTNAHGVFTSSDQIKMWYPSSKGLPNNTRIISMASFSHLLFAGTYTNGVFVSADRGEHWRPSNSGLKNFTVRCFNANGSILLAGTDSGIYSSSDNGNVWILQESSFQINDCKSTTNVIFATTNQGVLASKDLGNTWEWILNDGAIFELAVSENEIYAMDFFGTVFRSNLTNFTWIKTDLYLPFENTFRLTPISRQFLTAAYGNLNQKILAATTITSQ